jgi:parallel beta-helix repeat protein
MRTASALLVLLALNAPAAAETLKVPGEFETIAAAVAAAAEGDTISVAKGTYVENLAIGTNGLKLVGHSAIIDGSFIAPCMAIVASDVSVIGFTLVNGTEGLVATGNGNSVIKCDVISCGGIGLQLEGGSVTIFGNTVVGCDDDGINFGQGGAGMTVIEKNTCARNDGNGIDASGSELTVSRNTCEMNDTNGVFVSVELLALTEIDDDPAVVIEKNECHANEDSGMTVFNSTGLLITIEKNDCSRNTDDGMFVDAFGAVIAKNTCDDNGDQGMELFVAGCTVLKNSASGNQDDGILITAELDLGNGDPASGNTLTGNTCKDNRGDGIIIQVGSGNVLEGNKCLGNLDDGIDLNFNGSAGNTLDKNNCSDNGHEGIDNSGQDTVMTDNVCKSNGRGGSSPDIAGTGDGGVGSVDTFDGNEFKTGGDTTPALLDNYDNTAP